LAIPPDSLIIVKGYLEVTKEETTSGLTGINKVKGDKGKPYA